MWFVTDLRQQQKEVELVWGNLPPPQTQNFAWKFTTPDLSLQGPEPDSGTCEKKWKRWKLQSVCRASLSEQRQADGLQDSRKNIQLVTCLPPTLQRDRQTDRLESNFRISHILEEEQRLDEQLREDKFHFDHQFVFPKGVLMHLSAADREMAAISCSRQQWTHPPRTSATISHALRVMRAYGVATFVFPRKKVNNARKMIMSKFQCHSVQSYFRIPLPLAKSRKVSWSNWAWNWNFRFSCGKGCVTWPADFEFRFKNFGIKRDNWKRMYIDMDHQNLISALHLFPVWVQTWGKRIYIEKKNAGLFAREGVREDTVKRFKIFTVHVGSEKCVHVCRAWMVSVSAGRVCILNMYVKVSAAVFPPSFAWRELAPKSLRPV